MSTVGEQEIDAVEASKVEQYIDEKFIGERIRRLRLKRSMGLVELGTRTGLSASFLSQLETGRVVPTIRNLAKLALVFEKDLSYFFKQERTVTFRTLRQDDRVRLTKTLKDGSRFISESLSALIPDRRMVPCLAEFLPGEEQCDFTPKIFPGTEFVYVLEGRLKLSSTSGEKDLENGDVGWIDGRTKRQYSCAGDDTARVIIITFPQD
jgi:transcriptional regulator with XRE-family HTH domain